MGKLNIKYNYPRNKDYDFIARLTRVNLDDVRKDYLNKGKGFVVKSVQPSVIKDLVEDKKTNRVYSKNDDGIYSTRFGQYLDDADPFMDRYSCKCGYLKKRFNAGITCPVCESKVEYKGDNFDYFGFITLKDPYYIIHPNLYKSIDAFIGRNKYKGSILDSILFPKKHMDKDGFIVNEEVKGYIGIGMLDFKDKFDEIMDYYLAKHKGKKKKEYYHDIMKNRDKIFIQSIPVYTTLLRPFKKEGKRFTFQKTNTEYHMMTKLAKVINDDDLSIFRKTKPKLQFLYDLNLNYQELYKKICELEGGKKGIIRELFGGRYAFTNRDTLVPEPTLAIDEISLSRVALGELMQQSIINVLKHTYNISFNQAYGIWFDSQCGYNKIVVDIMNQFIKKQNGIPVLINRNPTINYGGILYMRVVKIVESYTMGIPLDICGHLGADFDGDVLNLHYIINEDFRESCNDIFNPKNVICISRNDGWVDSRILPYKDLLININTLAHECRQYYSPEQKAKLEAIVRRGGN